jgi:hypothetical protein
MNIDNRFNLNYNMHNSESSFTIVNPAMERRPAFPSKIMHKLRSSFQPYQDTAEVFHYMETQERRFSPIRKHTRGSIWHSGITGGSAKRSKLLKWESVGRRFG